MYLYRQTETQGIIEDIRNAINGEYSAIQCYQKLAQKAPNRQQREQIQEIRQDEIKHYQRFMQIYTSLTGQQPQPQITEECPDNYTEGLIASFKDEQETTDFYLEFSEQARTPYIKEVFRSAAADEQNHAVWFLSFLTIK
ncbi:ferritin-like domain-containing protein [Alkalihalobacillus sp. AL-G]|uniref:ferritin-like domain-containing protein n=1 Tax=Alkalihalobacillus sp. AL-G TaxID=2926399 RepID=UPI00272DAE85|nr:ferritin-like domain-containing protein [Alkalihalobacillus sp. AL-G]WLD94242.1 ferritin-like domain-containing protein [Alkalihalobacillus sp. AL-G]